MKKIILEELNRVKLLMKYDNKTTLSENLEKINLLEEVHFINEAVSYLDDVLKSLFNTSDDTAIAALKSTQSPAYKNAISLFDDVKIYGGKVGFNSADELLTAMSKGTLTKAQFNDVAKGLLTTGKATGGVRTLLTNKAAEFSFKDARYANMSGPQLKQHLISKGYDPSIADEIAVKFANKKMKAGHGGGGRNNPNNPQGGGRNNPNNPQGGGQGGANQLNWVRSVSDKQQKLIRDLYKKHKENRAYARKWAIGAGIGALAFAILWERLMREDETNTDELCPDGQYFDDEKQTCVTIPPPPPPPSPGCTDFPYKQGCKSPIISDIQNCLGELTVDGNYGPKTRERLIELGYDTLITKEVYDKIMKNCGGKPDEDENDNKRADDRAYDDEY